MKYLKDTLNVTDKELDELLGAGLKNSMRIFYIKLYKFASNSPKIIVGRTYW